jgi:hypothetical protein
MKIATNYRELEAEVLEQKGFVEVTEDLYYEALEVLPPHYLSNGTFQVDECVTADLYHTFGQKDGKYYGCLCNANFSLNNF